MKKLANLFFLVLLIGAAVPVSAAESTNSNASITFYPSANKVVPMKQVILPENQEQTKIEIPEAASEETIAGFLPKTNEERTFFSEVMGIGFLMILLFFIVYKKITNGKKDSQKSR
jgi:LPXTG-motif cell wall-anchored protein